jgi:tRNA nucleotidyltransferase/poly(A) polymerase
MTPEAERAAALAALREGLAGAACWIVGGAVRDSLRGAGAADFDLVLDGEVAPAARRLARAGDAFAFALSDEFGAWRVVARSGAWHADLNPLRGGSLEADLALRDFTVNAIAEPLAGGELVDPLGGAGDLERGVLRLAAAGALDADPLRAMRLVRLHCELGLDPDADALAAARRVAPRLREVAGERIYSELVRVLAADRAAEGVALLGELGLSAVVLPELDALGGVGQSRFHHLDVAGHTLAALRELLAIEADPGALFGAADAAAIGALLREPLADEITRGTALRLGVLLHDIAKPLTRTVAGDGRVAFPGHDVRGAEVARRILGRLRAAERVRAYVAALTLHHLRLGFLVHHRPLSRGELYDYLTACGPVAADVTLLSVADRLATRGERAAESIDGHLALAGEVIGEALRWHADGPPRPPLRGEELIRELGIPAGPQVGELLAATARAAFTGEITATDDALAYARELIA